MSVAPGIIVHSGAGYFPDERNPIKLELTKRAVLCGAKILKETDDPVLAVEAAVKVMEDDPAGNAGYGSVLTCTGQVEMDAMIIRGKDLATGGVGAVGQIKNPISVAKRVMETTKHALLTGEGALKFAQKEGFTLVSNEELVSPMSRALLQSVLEKNVLPSTEVQGLESVKEKASKKTEDEKEEGLGTVGAVAINSKGELAAATSTGGLCGKLPGRVGDTPIPGGGTFCDDTSCGVSATGLGESIMRYCVSAKIAGKIEQGEDPDIAIMQTFQDMTARIGNGDGGAILIRRDGYIAKGHNSQKMTWASVQGEELKMGLENGKIFIEKVEL